MLVEGGGSKMGAEFRDGALHAAREPAIECRLGGK
jgi:hypothetical protein